MRAGREQDRADARILEVLREFGMEGVLEKAEGLQVERDWHELLSLGEQAIPLVTFASEPALADRRESTICSRGSLPALIGVALCGCVHITHTVPPYRDDGFAAQELADRARSSCLERTSQLPPRPFATDGCSAFADAGWVECCVEHDAVYWCGGTAEGRRQADRRLEQCVAELGHPCLARLMYLGVRAGAPAWIPLPWRWGFGWDFPADGDPRDGPASRRDAAGASAVEPLK